MKKLLLIFFLMCSPAWGAVTTLYPTADTKLNPDASTTNYSSDPACGNYEQSKDIACLIKFDLTGYDSASVVTADFVLYTPMRGYGHNVAISRLTRDWVGNQATWNIFSTGNNWGTAGAKLVNTDFVTADQQIAEVPNGGTITVDATELVKAMIDNGNYGFLIRGVNSDMSAGWKMSEYEGTDDDPQLIIRTGIPGQATTWYVRTDGGTCGPNLQCEGVADAAYPGSGVNQACACSKVEYLSDVMQGEDIAIIDNDTFLNEGEIVIPAGTSPTLKTKLYGRGWDTGCADPPQVSGSNVTNLLTLGSYVEVNCVDLVDSDGCIGEIGAGGKIDNEATQDLIRCATKYSSVNSVWTGIKLVNGAANVTLKNMHVNGMAYTGMEAYSGISNLVMDNFHISGSGFVGINGGDSPNTDWVGPTTFVNSSIKYSGCGWRAKATPGGAAAGTPHNCWSQDQGGYGDAIGANVKLASWTSTDSEISNNVSDGFDSLYDPSATYLFKRFRAEGNAGAAFKSSSPFVTIENSVLLGNCAQWAASPDVFASIYAPGRSGSNCDNDDVCDANENSTNCSGDCAGFNVCRPSQQTTLSLACWADSVAKVLNSTISGNGDTLLFMDYHTGCDSDSSLVLQNTIWVGGTEYNGGESDTVDAYYGEGAGSAPTITQDHNLYCGTKTWETDDVGVGDISMATCTSVFSGTLNNFAPGYYTGSEYINEHYLAAEGEAVDAADEAVGVTDDNDVNNFDRGAAWDLGGFELGSTPPAPSCNTVCSLCDSAETCTASQANCFPQLNGSCGTVIDPCNSSCLNCSSQALCEASTIPCYYWSTNQCQPTEEAEEPTCDDDCTLCGTPSACAASTFTGGCFTQLDGTCKATEDPCNTYCGNCSSEENCWDSTLGCYYYRDNRCRSTQELGPNTFKGSGCWRGTPNI